MQGPSSRPCVYYHSSFFATKLWEGGTYNYDKVKRWTLVDPKLPKDDLANWKLNGVCTILLPVNIDNMHWILAGIFVKEKKIICYDSLEVSICLVRSHVLRFPLAPCIASSHVIWCPLLLYPRAQGTTSSN
jgi:Ulp1 family protease